MKLNTRKEKNALVVSVEGRIDAFSAPEFTEELAEWIDEGESCFIIDFSKVDYISSAGLRSILTTAKKLETKKGQLLLADLKHIVKEVFTISGLASLFQIFESVEEALNHV